MDTIVDDICSNCQCKSSPPPETLNKVDGNQNNKAYRMIILFVATAIVCFVISLYSSPLELVNRYNSLALVAARDTETTSAATIASCHGNQSTMPKLEKVVDLRSILENAAMDDKTVLITLLNKAWAEPNSIFDLFLESFWSGYQTQKLLKHLVVVTLDEYAFARCSQVHSHCYAHDTNGTDLSGEAGYMKPTYLNIVWWKLDFLGSVLKLGYNFLFTDTDIMWFRDPFPHLQTDADIQISSDRYNGNASDINNLPNAGFIFVKSNNRAIEFFKFWLDGRERFPSGKTQDVLNMIKYEPYMSEIGIQIRFLDTTYFGGFCAMSKDLNKVFTMHANCCIGLGNKVFDLGIVLNNWQNYMSSQMNGTPQNISWTFPDPQRCRMDSFNWTSYKPTPTVGRRRKLNYT